MTYSSLQLLTDRYGAQMLLDLTDRADVATGQIDTAIVDAALAGADALIDGYLQGIYALPLSPVPALISDLATVITIWRLHIGIPGEKIAKDYEDALKRLAQISAGTIKLGVAGIETPGAGATGVQVVDRERPFTAETMTGFI